MRCVTCKEDVDVSKFHKNRSTKSGYQHQCKDCRMPSKNNKEYQRRYAAKNREEIREKKEQWRKDNRSLIAQYRVSNRENAKLGFVKWKKNNAHKLKAQGALNRALKKGYVEKSPCYICDDPKSQGHHEDYSKPLEVVWLCAKHHKRRHVELENFEKGLE